MAASPIPNRAGDWTLSVAGVRGGFAANTRGGDIQAAEVFAGLDTPLRWEWPRDWQWQSRIVGSAGWLGGRGDDALLAMLGPVVELQPVHWPITLEGGVAPTLLSQHKFGPLDLGYPLQFTSHVGVNLALGHHWVVGYGFQHTSNAGLDASNPGLNLHVVSLGYRF